MVDIIDENAVNVYTDGSSYSGPRKGGMGIVFVVVNDDGNEVTFEEQPAGYQGATNQQMELQACIEALKVLSGRRSPVDLSRYRKIIIKTDSMYVVENKDRAKYEWSRSKWLTRDGSPVANTAQWKELIKRSSSIGKPVDFRWVKGHKSSTYNKRADKLAKGSAKGVLQKPLMVTSVRRKKTSKKIERGSVKLSGQLLTIRVITVEHLKHQRCFKYKYEVMSKKSPYFGNVDLAYSHPTQLMRDGHTYFVRFNADSRNPWVVKVFREIIKVRPSKTTENP